ncbi:hypothetical protein [Klebsiella quasipneumoniae]|uniref:hypothetical protein n=1 Tax=Klebsiella TaxID=570 RepID=UPI001F4DFE0A|nr:hypothetical protein [Klebsiella quasipneumoniae]MCH9290874.1 hypothetical protein [Klebsiella quasipneumoniae]HBR1004048.1 hypothetical protein [Klebsiella quasipneumoniae subsp. quasipneumoniae]HCI6267661.1 hypothetical protein [Klebsiella quasipneumoniae subsp. quasipneumoniae]HCI6752968.1 hypothetical protein [Klebsiella quasipneumoniae subsp. quasipneumoniae]
MKNFIIRTLVLALFFFSSVICACGDNPNALVQGPFKDNSFTNGFICFQYAPDKRDIDFYLSRTKDGELDNSKIDTFHYSDAPVELMTIFFMQVNGHRNVVALLRWHVNYESNGVEYPYYYEVKTYKHDEVRGYIKNLDGEIDSELSGYQIKRNGNIKNFPLGNAEKIKHFLRVKYSM